MKYWRCLECGSKGLAEFVCEVCGKPLGDGRDLDCPRCTSWFLEGERAWRDFQALEAEIHTVVEPFLPPFDLDTDEQEVDIADVKEYLRKKIWGSYTIHPGSPRIAARYAALTPGPPPALDPNDLDARLERITR